MASAGRRSASIAVASATMEGLIQDRTPASAMKHESIIHSVRKRPYLYVPDHERARDKAYKLNGWREIAEEENMTPEEVRRLWIHLREKYCREKHQTKNSHSSKGRTWGYFKSMNFLAPYVKHRNQKSIKHERKSDLGLEESAISTPNSHFLMTTMNGTTDATSDISQQSPTSVMDKEENPEFPISSHDNLLEPCKNGSSDEPSMSAGDHNHNLRPSLCGDEETQLLQQRVVSHPVPQRRITRPPRQISHQPEESTGMDLLQNHVTLLQQTLASAIHSSPALMPFSIQQHRNQEPFMTEIPRENSEISTDMPLEPAFHEDEDFLFAKTIVANLRRLAPAQKSLAKIKIQILLHELEFPNIPV